MKNSRFMFPGAKQFRKVVGENFLIATRNIYKEHPYYKYEDDEQYTQIYIDLSYANKRYDGIKPSFIVKVGAYNKDLSDTLASNMSEEIVKDGRVVGYKRRKIIRLPITVIVHSYSEEECSDLSDELSDLCLVFRKHEYSKRGVVPMGAHVSETDIFDDSQGIYQTTISFTMDVPWVYQEENTMQVGDFEFGFDIGTGNDLCDDGNSIYDEIGYSQPGVEVYRDWLDEYKIYKPIVDDQR